MTSKADLGTELSTRESRVHLAGFFGFGDATRRLQLHQAVWHFSRVGCWGMLSLNQSAKVRRQRLTKALINQIKLHLETQAKRCRSCGRSAARWSAKSRRRSVSRAMLCQLLAKHSLIDGRNLGAHGSATYNLTDRLAVSPALLAVGLRRQVALTWQTCNPMLLARNSKVLARVGSSRQDQPPEQPFDTAWEFLQQLVLFDRTTADKIAT